MESLKKGPPDFVKLLSLYSNIINTWKLGSQETFGYTTMQLNIADVQHVDDST